MEYREMHLNRAEEMVLTNQTIIVSVTPIRNKLKVRASISNAEAFIRIQKEFGSFDKYIWGFVNGRTIINKWEFLKEIPAGSEESDLMSIDMKKRGFKFIGTTICYAFMQATGLVNDHTIDCFRYKEVNGIT